MTDTKETARLAAAKERALKLLEDRRAEIDSGSADQKILPPGAERRTSPRLGMITDVTIGLEQADFYTGFSENISSGGLFVATFAEGKQGDRYLLQFKMPDGTVINAVGEVTWSRAYNESSPDTLPGMGLSFVDLKESDQLLINAYISKYGSLFFE